MVIPGIRLRAATRIRQGKAPGADRSHPQELSRDSFHTGRAARAHPDSRDTSPIKWTAIPRNQAGPATGRRPIPRVVYGVFPLPPKFPANVLTAADGVLSHPVDRL